MRSASEKWLQIVEFIHGRQIWVLVNRGSKDSQKGYQWMGFPWNFLSSSLGNFAWVKTFETWTWEVPALSRETGYTIERDFWLFPLLCWASKTDSNSTIHYWIELINLKLSQTVSIILTSSTRSTISRSSDWSSEYFVSLKDGSKKFQPFHFDGITLSD